MAKRKALIIAGSPAPFADLLPPAEYEAPAIASSAAAGRRLLAQNRYDMILISEPLPDESGISTANAVSGLYNQYVLLTVPAQSLDQAAYQCRDLPVFVLSSTAQKSTFVQSIRFLEKAARRQARLEKQLAKEKQRFQDEKTVTLCKLKLIETFHWSEDKAHKCITKTAMDHSVTKSAAAKALLRKMEMMAAAQNQNTNPGNA